MRAHHLILLLLTISALAILSCTVARKRMPYELASMHDFLTRRAPDACSQYNYNAKREIPHLFKQDALDSVLYVIDYVETECGPNPHLDVTKLLLAIGASAYDDSLVGRGTVGQMLWLRSEQDYRMGFAGYRDLYASTYPVDNTDELYNRFLAEDLAVYADRGAAQNLAARALATGFQGNYDSAFALIQLPEMRGTGLRRAYDDYIDNVKHQYGEIANIAVFGGVWSPRGNNRLFGQHPDFGFQAGGETPSWRSDFVLSLRTGGSANSYAVQSNGTLVSTTDFSSMLIGVDVGYKFLDLPGLSSDLFVGLGYDAVYSIDEGDNERKIHGSPAASIGLRQRFFFDRRSGFYMGLMARYELVGYSNRGGTSLSGNTLTISFLTGVAANATRSQFLQKLNYQGNWRK